jgi:hypothetical protein
MTDDEAEVEQLESQYNNLKPVLQQTVDAVAQYEPHEIEQHGMKTQIAREHGVDDHRIHYVLNHYNNIVKFRRGRMRSPVEPNAVKAAYEDETMQQLAMSDGGKATVSIDFTLDEAFRAMKLLPGDLGLDVYRQLLSQDFDKTELRDIDG